MLDFRWLPRDRARISKLHKPVPAERTLSPGKPVTERWQIFGLLVPLGLIAVPVLVDRGCGQPVPVERALWRHGLLLPRGYRADRKSWVMLRRKVFRDPRTQRNRVWQTDFSEFETIGGGIWRSCAVIDYATKYCLTVTVTPTARGADVLACLRLAVTEAERSSIWTW